MCTFPISGIRWCFPEALCHLLRRICDCSGCNISKDVIVNVSVRQSMLPKSLSPIHLLQHCKFNMCLLAWKLEHRSTPQTPHNNSTVAHRGDDGAPSDTTRRNCDWFNSQLRLIVLTFLSLSSRNCELKYSQLRVKVLAIASSLTRNCDWKWSG